MAVLSTGPCHWEEWGPGLRWAATPVLGEHPAVQLPALTAPQHCIHV